MRYLRLFLSSFLLMAAFLFTSLAFFPSDVLADKCAWCAGPNQCQPAFGRPWQVESTPACGGGPCCDGFEAGGGNTGGGGGSTGNGLCGNYDGYTTASTCQNQAPGTACNGFPGICIKNAGTNDRPVCGCQATATCSQIGGTCSTATCASQNRTYLGANLCTGGANCCGAVIATPAPTSNPTQVCCRFTATNGTINFATVNSGACTTGQGGVQSASPVDGGYCSGAMICCQTQQGHYERTTKAQCAINGGGETSNTTLCSNPPSTPDPGATVCCEADGHPQYKSRGDCSAQGGREVNVSACQNDYDQVCCQTRSAGGTTYHFTQRSYCVDAGYAYREIVGNSYCTSNPNLCVSGDSACVGKGFGDSCGAFARCGSSGGDYVTGCECKRYCDRGAPGSEIQCGDKPAGTACTTQGGLVGYCNILEPGGNNSECGCIGTGVGGPVTPAQRLVCQNNACVAVAGAGINECTSSSQCQPVEQPPVGSHLECRDNACVSVPGTGGNSCTTDTECIVNAPTHLKCDTTTNACVIAQGSGANECGGTESSCHVLPPTPTHTECRNDACVSVSGDGSDECTTNAECGGDEVTPPNCELCQYQIDVFWGPVIESFLTIGEDGNTTQQRYSVPMPKRLITAQIDKNFDEDRGVACPLRQVLPAEYEYPEVDDPACADPIARKLLTAEILNARQINALGKTNATARIKNNSTSCDYTIGFASYKANWTHYNHVSIQPSEINTQNLFDHKAQVIKPGETVELTINMPTVSGDDACYTN